MAADSKVAGLIKRENLLSKNCGVASKISTGRMVSKCWMISGHTGLDAASFCSVRYVLTLER